MTGFATASRDTPFGQLIIEIRSVNSRFLDLSFRLPDELRAAEWPLRELISGAVLRGKLECRVGLRVAAAGEARIDEQALSRLAALAATVRGRFPQAAEPTIGELLRFPGVMSSEACCRRCSTARGQRSRRLPTIAAAKASGSSRRSASGPGGSARSSMSCRRSDRSCSRRSRRD
jgi:uncharacterized protein YicC (UPF0701 family)